MQVINIVLLCAASFVTGFAIHKVFSDTKFEMLREYLTKISNSYEETVKHYEKACSIYQEVIEAFIKKAKKAKESDE